MPVLLAAPSPAPAARAQRSSAAPSDGALFRAHIAKSAPSAPVSPASPLGSLEDAIAQRLRAGASPADIANELAASLAAAVAQQLGLTGAGARTQLQAAFASALAPPGSPGSSGSLAERARALAQRFADIANVAAGAARSAESGQQKRIVGNVLDAATARETPAQAGTDPLSSVPSTNAAAQLLASAASAFLASSVASSAPAAGDGRAVAFAPAEAVAAGGDTPLGRILARAAAAADQRQTAVAESGGAAADAAATVRPSSDAGVASFLQSFAAALATRADETRHAETLRDGISAAAADAPATDGDAPAFVPAAPPFAVDTAAHDAPAAAAQQAPADANAIVDQVLRGAFLRNVGQSTEMRLQLVPEHLGDVTVKLVLDGGTINAHVVAQTADVRDALVAGQAQLTKSLSDAGLKLASFTVDVANNGFAGFAQQQQQSQQRPTFGRRLLLAGSAAGDDGDDPLQAIPTFGPPLVGGADLGALDYLV